jgi:hypothetical protein
LVVARAVPKTPGDTGGAFDAAVIISRPIEEVVADLFCVVVGAII